MELAGISLLVAAAEKYTFALTILLMFGAYGNVQYYLRSRGR